MVLILSYFSIPYRKLAEWDSKLRPRAYRAHTLTTELSGQTMRCA